MANQHILEGTPYKRHFYLGHSPGDAEVARGIVSRLKASQLYAFEKESFYDERQNIQTGMDTSRKVVLLVSQNYLKYEWRPHQVNVAKEIADAISADNVIVVKAPDVSDKALREAGLADFRSLAYIDSTDFWNLLERHIIDEAVIPPEAKPNMGAAMAYSYYYGYLRIILPGMAQRIRDTSYINLTNPNERNMPQTLFVIIPETLRGPPSLEAMDSSISDIGKIQFRAGRGGNVARDYSSFVHQIKHQQNTPQDGLPLYNFLGEVPSILINLYDMEMAGTHRMDRRKKSLEVRQFYCYLQKLLSNDDECKDQVTFIFHADESTTACNSIGDIICHKVREAIDADVLQDLSLSDEKKEVERIKVDGETVKEVETGPLKENYLRHPLNFYQMDRKPVGQALIINNIRFTDRPERKGASKDEAVMQKQLEKLNFEVSVWRDLTAKRMLEIASIFSEDQKHADSQAFVCVIMTHGECGKVFGTDGTAVNFVDICDILGKCKALKGKPKMFFVESSQSAESHKEEAVNMECDGDVCEVSSLRRRLIPTAADCLIGFSTLPGDKSFRHILEGSLYIQSLCNLIEEHHAALDLEQILKLVSSSVQERLAQSGVVDVNQIPFVVSSLDKLIALKQ